MNALTRYLKLPLLLTLFLISINAQSQNFLIQGITIPPNLTNCSPSVFGTQNFLGCINFNFDSTSFRISNDTVFAGVYYTGSPICFGAISSPTHDVPLGLVPPNTYTVIAQSFLDLTLTGTVTGTMTINACCTAIPSFTSSTSTTCPADTVFFTNTSVNQTGQVWYVDGVAIDTSLNFEYLFPAGSNPYTSTVTMTAIGSGCRDSVDEIISVSTLPTANIGNDTSVCDNSSVLFDAGSQWDYVVWNTGDTAFSLLVDTTGLYIATVYDNNGCRDSDSATLTDLVAPTVELGMDTILCSGTTYLLDAGNPGSSFLWNTGDTTQTYLVASTNGYAVTVTAPNGCETYDSVFVSYRICAGLENKLGANISVFPNPASNQLIISGEQLKDAVLSISGVDGKTQEVQIERTSNGLNLDLSELSSGVYFIHIRNEKDQATLRFIKE